MCETTVVWPHTAIKTPALPGYLTWAEFKWAVDKYLLQRGMVACEAGSVEIEYIDISWPTSVEAFVIGVERGMLQIC